MHRRRNVVFLVLSTCLHDPVHASDPPVSEAIALRAGSTVFQEVARTVVSAAVPGPLGTALYYTGYKVGADLTEYGYRQARGEDGKPPQLREVGLVTVAATAGSLVGGRVLGPQVGGWVGQWVGWSFAETLNRRVERGEGWDPRGALKEMNLGRVATGAVVTEAAGLAAVRAAGLDPALPAVGASPARVVVGLAAKVVTMGAVQTGFNQIYDRVTGAERKKTYTETLEELRSGDPARARQALERYNGR